MARQPLVYEVELAGRSYEAHRVRGREAISGPFRLEVTLVVDPSDPLDPNDAVGTDATLVLRRDGEVRRVRAVATDVQRTATRRGNEYRVEVALVLEPRLATLRYRVDIRVFRDKTAPEIVTEVLSALGVTVAARLSGTYERRPYCVQMRESDLAFCSRLLEDEGIFSFFDDAGALVLGDTPAAYDDPDLVMPFRFGSGLDAEEDEVVTELGWVGRVTAGKVTLRDFNHEHPSLDMDVSATAPWAEGPEWYDYPGEYALPPEGSRKARLRADALECAHHQLTGRAFSGKTRPGVVLTIFDAPESDLDGGYVITEVEHDWSKERQGFSVTWRALPRRTTFRPLAVTDVPTLRNPLTGFVTGAPGEDIHTDEWGRGKVHFPWDRLQPKDDRCSHWIPVLQENTGSSLAQPRVGWEVLCHFLEGDPDRPVIIGRVYNPDDTFPELLPEQKTVTSLRSLSSPGRKGTNQIRIDDLAGQESVLIHAEKDQNVVVANDKREEVQNSESNQVRGNETIDVGVDQTIQVKRDMKPRVAGNQTLTIGGSRKVEVASAQSENVKGDRTLTIGGSHVRKAGDADSVNVAKNLKEAIGGIDLEGSVKTNTARAQRLSALLVGGAIIELAKAAKTETTGKHRGEAIGALLFTKAKDRIGLRAGKKRITKIGALLKVEALKHLVMAGIEKLTMKATTAKIEGDEKLTLRVGETEVIFAEGRITMKARDTIRFETTGQSKQGAGTATQIP